MKPTARAQHILNLMREITELLDQENILLKTPKSTQLFPIVKKKQELFSQYEAQLTQLQGGQDLRATLSPELRKEIEIASKNFQKTTRINELKLTAMVKSSEQIVDLISQEARKHNQPASAYNQRGANLRTQHRAAAIAVNQHY